MSLLSTLYDDSRGIITQYAYGGDLPDLTPEQAEEVKEVLGQVARDPNALTDPAVLEGLEPAERDAVLLLLKNSLP